MSDGNYHLDNPPTVEAILDIDCSIPPAFDLEKSEKHIRDLMRDSYPEIRHQYFQEHQITQDQDQSPKMQVNRGLQALQFVSKDKKQLAQFRSVGYSFNRLSPYSSLDKYLPEIKRTWELYSGFVKPVQIRKIGLRTINRILIPLTEGGCDIDKYLKTGPKLPGEDELIFTGFLNHHTAVEKESGNRLSIVLTTQNPEESALPVILDIDAFLPCEFDPLPWSNILDIILALRGLKNRVFSNTLTETCLSQYLE